MGQAVYRFGQCEVNHGRCQILLEGKPVDVQPRIFDLLFYLIENRGRVVDKDELLDQVWRGNAVSESSLTQAIRRARAVTGDDGERQQIIQTIQGRGYRFVAEVDVFSDVEPAQKPAATPYRKSSVWPIVLFLLALAATVAWISINTLF